MSDDASAGSFYPATHWTQILQAQDLDKTLGRDALGQVLTRYRSALLRHLQWKFQSSPEQAEDWLQGFVERKVLENHLMQSANRERGRFRNFLLSALDRFVWDEIKFARAQKRKPAEGFVAMEEAPEIATPTAGDSDPGDIEWARDVLEQAIGKTRNWYLADGNAVTWEVFNLARVQPLLGLAVRPSDEEIGKRCGVPTEKVSNIVNNAARKFRTELRNVVAEYATNEGEIEEELQAMIDTLRRAV